jgi:drug/metabolite transporter (DMT)-like permease
MWFTFALTFAFTTSLGGILSKRILKELDELTFIFLSFIFTAPFLLILLLAFYQIPKVDTTFFLAIASSVILDVIAFYLAIKAIKMSEISLVNPISSFNPVFASIIAFFVLGERLSIQGIVGILIIVIGAYVLQVSSRKKGYLEPLIKLFSHKGVQMSLGAYFLWSITPIFQKIAINHTTPSAPPFASFAGLLGGLTIYGFFSLYKKISIKKNIVKFAKLFTLIGVLGGLGQSAAFITFSLTNLGIAVAVFKLSMIFTVILGWLVFKEKEIKSRLFGSIIMLVGIILLVV